MTTVELLIGSAISVLVLGAVLAVVTPVQAVVRAQGDTGDMHQRLRAAADALTNDVRLATSVRPYRVGAIRDDGLAGVYYRPDTIAIVGTAVTTYYWKRDTLQLMQYDGERSDLPMIDHVVRLTFDYLAPASVAGTALVIVDPATLIDGPWTEDATHRRFDVDVLRVCEVRISLRLQATAPSLRALVPDNEVVLHAALRNSLFAR
jgi:hypothetical protein